MVITTANYTDFVALTKTALGIGVVFYYDATGIGGDFYITALCQGGLFAVQFLPSAAPASFSSDFPNAIAITGALNVSG